MIGDTSHDLAMARDASLPKPVARVHAARNTPLRLEAVSPGSGWEFVSVEVSGSGVAPTAIGSQSAPRFHELTVKLRGDDGQLVQPSEFIPAAERYNAMSIIELQLGLLDRQSGGNPTLRNHLREIRGCLGRMTDIVASLKHIRRVVLTDYAPGQKMIDLERSVEVAEVHVPPIGPTPGTRV